MCNNIVLTIVFLVKSDEVNYTVCSTKLVYVIGLHAVQFGNNWMKKFRGQPKLDEAVEGVKSGICAFFKFVFKSVIKFYLAYYEILYNNYSAESGL